MPASEEEEFEFRLRAERERPVPAQSTGTPKTLDEARQALEKIQPTVAPTAAPPDQRGFLQRAKDKIMTVPDALASMGSGMVGGLVGPVVGAGRELLTGDFGKGTAERTAQQVQQAMPNPAASNPNAQKELQSLGKALDKTGLGKLAGIGPSEAMALGSLVGPVAGQVGRNARSAAVETGLDQIPVPEVSIPDPIKNVVGTIFGSQIPGAKKEAIQAVKKAVGEAAAKSGAEGSTATGRAGKLAETQAELAKRAEATRSVPPGVQDLGGQGGAIRQQVEAQKESAWQARASMANQEFPKAKAIAAAKEATGQMVDTSKAEAALSTLTKKAEGIPGLETDLNKFLSAIRGPAAAEPKPQWSPVSITQPAKTASGKTFDQLEITRRYLNDVANSGPFEGYGSIVKRAAAEAAAEIDTAMQKFVPEFKAYKDRYAAMSQPMNFINTRLGKALLGTEGGLQGDAFAKVAPQDLPGKLFAKRDGQSMLVEILAGGPDAAPAAKVAAAQKVNQMVENWILETTRPKSAAGALEHMQQPQMTATMAGSPVKEALEKKFGSAARMETQAKEAGDLAKGLGEKGKAATKVAEDMRLKIKTADLKAAQPGKSSQEEAFRGYKSALESAWKDGAIPEPQYKAALALFDRAATLEEQTKSAQRIAKWAVYVAGGGLISHELYGRFEH